MRDLRFDNKTIREVGLYVGLLYVHIPHDRYEIKKFLRRMPQVHNDYTCHRQASQAYFENLLTLQSILNPNDADRIETVRSESQDIQTKGECYTLRDLSVNGEDLAAVGVPRGKEIGMKLEEILDEVMRDPAKNFDV